MKQKISRFITLHLTRFLMRFFYVFPLKKNRVFFSAYEGKQYSCNPKAVFEKMLSDERFKNFEFVWELNNNALQSNVLGQNIKFVKHNTLKYFYYVLTSKFLITNSAITARIPVRKNQMNLNTWHGGGAYKRVGHATNNTLGANLAALNIASNQTTHFLSSSRIFTDVMLDSINLPKERFVPCGMPRNDVFFDDEKQAKIRKNVINKYNLENDVFLILYAPTYRGSIGGDTFAFDFNPLFNLKAELEKKTGKKAVLMIRMHYFNPANSTNENAISVSDYPDMQELLAAADMLITDYSSSVWDFGLTGKPCLLYTPDLDEYDIDRGFYTPPATWPGILCKTEAELLLAVQTFDKEIYKKHLDNYFKNSGSYDNGTATQTILNLIESFEG